MTRITLGKRYRDTVSGWEGTATAEYRYMNGCVRYELSGTDKDGKPDSYVFDVQQIAEIDATTGAEVVEPPKLAATGGPRSSAPVARH